MQSVDKVLQNAQKSATRPVVRLERVVCKLGEQIEGHPDAPADVVLMLKQCASNLAKNLIVKTHKLQLTMLDCKDKLDERSAETPDSVKYFKGFAQLLEQLDGTSVDWDNWRAQCFCLLNDELLHNVTKSWKEFMVQEGRMISFEQRLAQIHTNKTPADLQASRKRFGERMSLLRQKRVKVAAASAAAYVVSVVSAAASAAAYVVSDDAPVPAASVVSDAAPVPVVPAAASAAYVVSDAASVPVVSDAASVPRSGTSAVSLLPPPLTCQTDIDALNLDFLSRDEFEVDVPVFGVLEPFAEWVQSASMEQGVIIWYNGTQIVRFSGDGFTQSPAFPLNYQLKNGQPVLRLMNMFPDTLASNELVFPVPLTQGQDVHSNTKHFVMFIYFYLRKFFKASHPALLHENFTEITPDKFFSFMQLGMLCASAQCCAKAIHSTYCAL